MKVKSGRATAAPFTANTIGYFFMYTGILSFAMRAVVLGPAVRRLGEAGPQPLRAFLEAEEKVADFGRYMQAGSFDACHRAGLVVVRCVTTDADSAEENIAVLDEDAARYRDEAALRQRIHGADEIGLLLGPLKQCPRPHAQRQRAISFAMRDLGAHQAGTVLGRRDFDAAAHIKDGDDKGLEFLLDALGEGGIENLAGKIESEFSHGSIPYVGAGWRKATAEAIAKPRDAMYGR